MTSPLTSFKHQMRGYLELEQLFGASELNLGVAEKSPTFVEETLKKELSLLVLLPEILKNEAEKLLLDKMLKTLGLDDSMMMISEAGLVSVDELIHQNQPKIILALGESAKHFGFDDFSEVSSKNYRSCQVLATWDTKHLLAHANDKNHSWQILLLLKSLI